MNTTPLGAWREQDKTHFRLWAPKADRAEVVLHSSSPGEKHYLKMEKAEGGYHHLQTAGLPAGTRYQFRLDEKTEIPDPASRYQPEGPHGPSEVFDQDFPWTDQEWRGVPLNQLVIYELHLGTFSEEGSFAGLEKKIPHLKSLGFNAIEIMPVAQFAGKRNWGYDGVGLFATHNTYGDQDISPRAFQRVVNACHQAGIAVILDVVYNHLGPEGNYLPLAGNYFQSKYKTPWGDALNYDGEDSDEVRNYFLENARQWFEDFHCDGLRLDAVHAILDISAVPFLAQLSDLAHGLEKKLNREIYLLAESDANDSRILKSTADGGHGMDGHWADDLHHVVHTLLTKENHSYYADYGSLEQLATVFLQGLLFQGEYSPFRRRHHGRSYQGFERHRLVVCAQNHDQIGNRRDGERLLTLVGPEKQKLAAACVLLSGDLPLIFMGEEIAETAPFQYFVDHTDKDLLEAVRKGRREEFASANWQGEAPDPASEETFWRSKLNWDRGETNPLAQEFKDYYKNLIELSKWLRKEGLMQDPHLHVTAHEDQQILEVRNDREEGALQMFFNFADQARFVKPQGDLASLEIALNSAENSPSQKQNLAVNELLEIKPFSAVVLRKRL